MSGDLQRDEPETFQPETPVYRTRTP